MDPVEDRVILIDQEEGVVGVFDDEELALEIARHGQMLHVQAPEGWIEELGVPYPGVDTIYVVDEREHLRDAEVILSDARSRIGCNPFVRTLPGTKEAVEAIEQLLGRIRARGAEIGAST